jgi:hypothetical protein
MMRALFQNKAFVAAWVVCAVLAVGWRVKSSWRPGFQAGSARELELPVSSGIANSEAAGTPSLAVEAAPWPDYRTNLADWPSLFPLAELTRDPFAATEPGWKHAVDLGTTGPIADTGNLVLQAISIQPGQALAVIDQQTLGIGESIGAFVVEEIRAHEVWLKHPQGRQVLSLRFGAHQTVSDSRSGQAKE